ncbi:unnamed protein product [Didymodactylos carnosus]|uniref:Uncharacterized protein n=1 Tax=Didymodactylos carnosus TaxID=1234261 RepID=A0A814NE57_9BILA|nr:unnamed protein product [Didymodactylos carnosus]CAF3857741.1 unnamed protein product [Didymodactylos carnosus]
MSFFRLFKKQKYASPTAEISTEDKDKREARRFNWTNVALGALIPLSIGIGTVVITLMQQKVDSQRQKQERELDDRRYNAERNEDDRRYNLEQDQADELYRQGLYKSTVEDISGALLKSNHTFLDDKTRLKISQRADVGHYSTFFKTEEAELHYSSDIQCEGGQVTITVHFTDIEERKISLSVFNRTNFKAGKWSSWNKSIKIPPLTEMIGTEIRRHGLGSCYMDNIKLSIGRRQV